MSKWLKTTLVIIAVIFACATVYVLNNHTWYSYRDHTIEIKETNRARPQANQYVLIRDDASKTWSYPMWTIRETQDSVVVTITYYNTKTKK